jgi:DNA-binding LacI/PurR family transcriptional regulator
MSVFMCDTRDDPERERRYVEMLAARRVDGLIVTGRRIAHVAGPERFLAARLRAQGFAAALSAAGLEPCGDVVYGEWSEHWGREAAGQLLASRPDAIFCGSDQIARGVADTLRAVGRRVPDDVALVGFDSWSPMTLGALPPLTSVDMCLKDVGRVAAELLLAAIGGERDHDVHTVPSRLAVRESSGGYPAAGDR